MADRAVVAAFWCGLSAWGPRHDQARVLSTHIVLGIILKRGFAEVLPLALGYAALPLGIVLAQLKSTSPARPSSGTPQRRREN